MKKVSFVFPLLFMLSLWATPASAQGGPPGPGGLMMGGGPGLLPPFVLKKLDLTDEQQAQVKGIIETHRETFRTLFGQLETAREELADKFYASGELSATDLTTQTQQINQVQEQITNEKLKVDLEVRAVLTPEQLTKAAQIKDQLETMHAEMKSLFKEQ